MKKRLAAALYAASILMGRGVRPGPGEARPPDGGPAAAQVFLTRPTSTSLLYVLEGQDRVDGARCLRRPQRS